jgi:hypothetical protein
MSDPHETSTQTELPAQRPAAVRRCPSCGQRLPSAKARATVPSLLALRMRARRVLAPIGERMTLPLACALSALPFAVAIALLAAGDWVAALLLLCGACLVLALLLALVSLDPDAPLARALPLAVAQVRLRGRLAYTAVAAWSRAGRELLRARRRQQRLHSERRARVASLGEAVLRGDYSRAASLKSSVRELGAEMQAHDHYAETALDIARDRIARERASQSR